MHQRILALKDVAEKYDIFLSDVWGVIHNGVSAYGEASKALQARREEGATVVLITNSPRPSDSVVMQLRQLGVPDEAYDGIVSSGDVTRALIKDGPKKAFLLGPERDAPLLEGTGAELVGQGEAEVVVCTGFFDDETETPDDYRDMLADFESRGLPMICANPDLVVERGHRMIPCAGAMAALYRQMGGKTAIAGKPHHPIYDAALAKAEEKAGATDKSRVLAIGDGMPTDVRGAMDYGLDLLYITHGIHAHEYVHEDVVDEARLNAFLTKEEAYPRFWMPRLV